MPDAPIHVNAEWYLARYPDVAQAGVNPQTHFAQNGYAEGRLPCALESETAENYLWRGVAAPMRERLATLQHSDLALERAYASWALARWYAQRGEWLLCYQAIRHFHTQPTPLPGYPGPWLLHVEAAASQGKLGAGFAALHALRERFPTNQDAYLAHSNLLGELAASSASRLAALAPVWRKHQLESPHLIGHQWVFNALSAPPLPLANVPSPCPCVTVMVPMFNAMGGIETALRGLLAQTWPSIELILVDDASTDETVSTVKRLLTQQPPRAGITVQVLRHHTNQGAYAARNTALAHATGALITTHDSDDWSHPQKLEYQARTLLANTALVGCFSHWVRADEALRFTHWCMETGWIYRNVSSLMLRREAVQQLGYWDNVTAAADTEYHQRLEAVFGQAAVIDVLPGVPLSIGRQAEGSLTQTSATHLTTMFQGVRQQYADAYQHWHAGFQQPSDAFLPRQPAVRPFPAPAAMCRESLTTVTHSPDFPLADTLQQSQWWDAGWYLRHHPDLWASKIDPLAHFMAHGGEEGRDPSAYFSSSAYAVCYAEQMQASGQRNPLVHFITQGRHHGCLPLPSFKGEQPRQGHRPTVLLCGHQAPAKPFGAERCLIDTARALEALAFNVIVVLPNLHSGDYWRALSPYVHHLHVVPFAWWRQGEPTCSHAVQQLRELIQTYCIDAVHVNTVVQEAPCLAAQAEGVPVVVHAHELPSRHTPLCDALNATPADIRQHSLGLAQYVIANSQAVANFFQANAGEVAVPLKVIPNTVDMAPLLALPPCPALINDQAPLRVGMLSSHQPEKGLADIVAVAKRLADGAFSSRPIEIRLFGPETPALNTLLAQQEKEGLTNLTWHGYVDSAEQALGELDVLINLSHVQESFGRTVLEAMTAARPVVCYEWGALPELVRHGHTGFLAPLGDTAAVADALQQLAAQPALLAKLGQQAQKEALAKYKPRHYVDAFASVYDHVFAAV